MNQDFITQIDILGVHKRLEPSKHYVYEIRVKWSTNQIYHIYRRYSDFFDFQNKLLNLFEHSDIHKHERVLPYIPGKIILGRSHIKSVALERSKPIEDYCKTLIALPSNYSRCFLVNDFFRVNDNDVKSVQTTSNLDINPNAAQVMVISKPIVNNVEYFMTNAYKSSYDDTRIVEGEKVELLNKNLNGWATIRYKNETLIVPYSFMTTDDRETRMNDRIVLINPEEYTVQLSYKPNLPDEISLERGTRVLVTEKNYSGYWKIRRLDSICGYAPSWCLDMKNEDYLVNQNSTNNSSFNYKKSTESPQKPRPVRPPPPPKTKDTRVNSASNSCLFQNSPQQFPSNTKLAETTKPPPLPPLNLKLYQTQINSDLNVPFEQSKSPSIPLKSELNTNPFKISSQTQNSAQTIINNQHIVKNQQNFNKTLFEPHIVQQNYESLIPEFANLVQGQKVIVTKILNLEECEILSDGKKSKALRCVLTKL